MMSLIDPEKSEGVRMSEGDELVEGFLASLDLDQTTRIDFDQELGLGWEQQTGFFNEPTEESSSCWTDEILETMNPTLNFPSESFPGDPLINGTPTTGSSSSTSTTGPICQINNPKINNSEIYKNCTVTQLNPVEAIPPEDCDEAKENLINSFCGFPQELLPSDEDEFKLPNNFILSEDYLLKCLANLKHFECKKCGKTFQQKRSLVRHTRNFTNCQIVFQENQPNVNDKIHDYVKTIKEKSFETSDNHEINTQCEICREHFGSVDKAQIHSEDHLNSKQCCKCYKVFGNKSKLKTHHRSHTKERPFHCSFCEKTFTECSSLRKHILTHGNRHFTCDICGKKFIRKDYLKKHMNSPKCVMFDIVMDGNI